MNGQILALSAEEVMVLTDRVKNDDLGTEDMRLAVYPLLLKLGSCYVEMVGAGNKKNGTTSASFSESELWLLRSKVVSGDKSANDALMGVKLLTKLYTALLACDSTNDFVESIESGEPMTAEKREKLNRYIAVSAAAEQQAIQDGSVEETDGAENHPNTNDAGDGAAD